MCPKGVTFLFFHLVESLICLYPYLCDSSFKTVWLVHCLFTYVGGTPKKLRIVHRILLYIELLDSILCSMQIEQRHFHLRPEKARQWRAGLA